jgi:hypothetical protein
MRQEGHMVHIGKMRNVSLKEEDIFEDLGINGRIILK